MQKYSHGREKNNNIEQSGNVQFYDRHEMCRIIGIDTKKIFFFTEIPDLNLSLKKRSGEILRDALARALGRRKPVSLSRHLKVLPPPPRPRRL